ncbi:MAG: hypothetical protein AAGJ32_09150 [Pseudomonadota bacterium]
MTLAAAEALTTGLGIYLLIGVLIALAVVTFGASRMDPDAKGMPIRARILIFPGAMLLWPIMAVKLFTQRAPPLV